MTTQQQTDQQPQAPDDLLALLLVQAATLLTLETGAAYAVTAQLRAALAAFARSANGRWLMAGAHPTSPIPLPPGSTVPAQLAAELDRIAAEQGSRDVLADLLAEQAKHALEVGAKHAGEQAGITVAADTLTIGRDVQAAISSTAAAVREHLARAVNTIEKARTGLDVQAALAQAQRAPVALTTGTTYVVNLTANDVARQVAKRLAEKLLWVAERNACIVCLALSGSVIDPLEGQAFDEEATFGKPGSAMEVWPRNMPLMRPPRHPHCRCQVCVWLGSKPGQPDLPTALRREAARSILKGWSLPSESHPARIAAARRLLDSGGHGLPKSVQAEARRAVAKGRFASREVPHYTPEKEHTHV